MHPLLKKLFKEFDQVIEKYAQPPPLTSREIVEFHYDDIIRARSKRVPPEPILQVFEDVYGVSMSLASLNCGLSAARKKRQASYTTPQDLPKSSAKVDDDIPF